MYNTSRWFNHLVVLEFAGAGYIMTQHRKLELKIPQSLYSRIEQIAKDDDRNIEDLAKDAINLYVREYEKMATGYMAMGQFNEEYAEMCLNADNQVLADCEEKLSESE